MNAPEDNPADDLEPTEEEWAEYEQERKDKEAADGVQDDLGNTDQGD